MPQRLDPQTLPSHVNRLYRAAWALCGSPHEAEDLVQETFVRVLARPRLLRGDDELAYLMRVLRNTFLDSRRTASRRPQVTAQLDDLELADERATDRPEQALEAQELYECDREAAGGLPSGAGGGRYRRAFPTARLLAR